MYIKITTTKDKKTNITRKYLRIVESYREKGKVRQRVIAHLGRIDLIKKEQLLNLSKSLARYSGYKVYREDEFSINSSFIFGPIILIRKIWEEIKLGEIIKGVCRSGQIAEETFVLTCCRILQPESEHGLSYFLKEYYVCDRHGRRWEPFFRDDIPSRLNDTDGKDRVKVLWSKLSKWYRTLDRLIENKEEIEKKIYEGIRNLFSLKVDIVFYDITSTYFEGEGPKDLAGFGYSRDGKKDNKQILLGIVLADGLPIAHHVLSGATQDKTTLKEVIEDLRGRFDLKNIIFVADKGITTKENIRELEEIGYKYILGVSLRRCSFLDEVLNKADKQQKRRYNETTSYTEVEIKDERWILVESEEKKGYERKMREVWMEKGAEELQRLAQRVKQGYIKDQRKIAYYLGGISKKYHIKRYFDWEIGEGRFKFFVSEKKISDEMMYEGKYLLRTTEQRLTAEQIIREYKNLWEIESCFREIKDVIRIRPIFHQTNERTKAHIFICVLGYLIKKIIQKRIKGAGMRITASDALEFLKEVKVVELEVGKDVLKLMTQKMNKVTERIFNLFGIKLKRGFKEGDIEEFTIDRGIQGGLFY